MAVPEVKRPTPKRYDYGDIIISLENCILPSERLDETPSMKDGLDRDTENDLRMFGCELIQTAGLLLRIPQVAMATGQVLLQRFYYTKSMVKHEVEVSTMAAIFLAAKIEESPRRLRDVINVCDHIKQKMLKKPNTPMDYFSNTYFNIKNAVIKAERRILKELGFCVHVKHPHKIVITYLQMLEHEKNVPLSRKAWNYMNDSLRTDVFVRFSPEVIACACIFLAARTVKVNLPLRPPWWELFDATFEEIEDISLCILRLYARRRRKITHLEAIVHKIKKAKQAKKSSATKVRSASGSFTPSHVPSATQPAVAGLSNNTSKPSSKTNSPVEKSSEKRTVLTSVVSSKKADSETSRERKRDANKTTDRHRERSESDYSSDYSSDSGAELPSKKYAQQRKQYENKKRRSPSSDSDTERRSLASKVRRSVSPVDNYRKSKPFKDSRDRLKDNYRESNGQYKNYDSYPKPKKRSRSRSPVKRGRSTSPSRKEKYQKDRSRDKIRSKDKYYDKYSNKIRR